MLCPLQSSPLHCDERGIGSGNEGVERERRWLKNIEQQGRLRTESRIRLETAKYWDTPAFCPGFQLKRVRFKGGTILEWIRMERWNDVAIRSHCCPWSHGQERSLFFTQQNCGKKLHRENYFVLYLSTSSNPRLHQITSSIIISTITRYIF